MLWRSHGVRANAKQAHAMEQASRAHPLRRAQPTIAPTGGAGVNTADAQQLLDEMLSRKAGLLNQRWIKTSLGYVLLAFDEDYCCCKSSSLAVAVPQCMVSLCRSSESMDTKDRTS
ncbi:hypothetical protein PVAP13_4NG300311 [Panicum virgatum]|uniref:Uncharacterized protein n=1 Tax=Panicum virgatum TaxID=38727 RepID=A0A8T0TIL7_PANVG|nr:hypothetical protein PVAP13_4NG300311 [Panicum virgatum]